MAISMSRSMVVLGMAAAGISAVAAGCSLVQRTDAKASTTAPATRPANVYLASKGDAQLWQESCSHCHNLRDPATYSDAQWEVAMFDMRVRAQLTGEEQRRILAFMKASNKK